MITNEQTSENGRVAIEVTVEPSEVKAWALESGFVEEGTDWGDDGTQRKLKSAIAARVEHALLNDRRPSPVTHPVIVSKDEVAEGEPFSLEASFFCCPSAELSSYEPIEIAWKRPVVSDEEVEQQHFEAIQSVSPTTPKAEGAQVEQNDTVDVSMLATSEGREYPALTAKSRLYDLGQGFMPKAFDDALLGLTVGQTAACDLKVPIADDASTASSDEGETKYRDVHVEMRVEGIYSDDVSTVGDEWIAAHFPGIKSVADMREGLRSSLQAERDARFDQAAGEQVMRKLTSRLDVALPDDLLRAQFEQALSDMRAQLSEQGMSLEDYMNAENLDGRQLEFMMMSGIRSQDRQMMALDAVARHEGFSVTQADRDRYVSMLACDMGPDEARSVVAAMYDAAFDEAVLRMMAFDHVRPQLD